MAVLSVHRVLLAYLFLWLVTDVQLEHDIEYDHHEKAKYFREENEPSTSQWNSYLSLIKEAEQRHANITDTRSIFRNQLDADFAFWKKQPLEQIHQQFAVLETIAKTHRLTLYQIINHRLYRQTEDELIFPARNHGIEHFLLNLLDSLPDMEFLVNTYDWPQNQFHIPVLSFSKSIMTPNTDILYPAWSFWDGGPALGTVYPTGIGRWDIMRQTLNKARQNVPWSKKDSRGFFRGSRTSDERDPLVLLSRAHPELLDAQYTKNQAWKSDADTLGYPPANELKHEEFCTFKYLFNFRGVAASFRFRHLFLCGSLVLHVGSDWLEFFYARLEPWYHYIPLSADLINVKEILLFAKANDRSVAKIARQGRDFIWNHLTMDNVEQYWKELLLEYHKLFGHATKTIVKRSNFVQVYRRQKP